MCKCDTCKVEESIRKSNEPACCAWYMDNVVISGASVDVCPVYKPIDSMQEVVSNLCPTMTGRVVRWINSEQFIAYITNRLGQGGEMICHKDYWTLI